MSTSTLINPATEQELRTVERVDEAGVDDAVARATSRRRSWAAAGARRPGRRAPIVRGRRRCARRRTRGARGGQLRAPDRHRPVGGRPRPRRAAVLLGRPGTLSGKQIPVAGGLDVTFNEPLGVVGMITPWNFPMTIASWGFAPALAAGNAVLVKPAEWTPLTTLRLGELALEAGLPDDLFQVLPGKGSVIGERFVTHPDVRKIVFTGSTEVGIGVMAGAAKQVKRVTLELGGKSANIVFDDCDLEKAAATAPYGVFDNAGQDCCARSRILVQRNVYDRFMETARARGARASSSATRRRKTPRWARWCPRRTATRWPPMCPTTRPSRSAAARPRGPGYWFPPTVLTPAAHRPHRHRGDLRPGGHGAAVRRRGRRHRAGQRHRIRPVRLDLDRQPVAGDAGVARRGSGQPVGQLALVGALQHAVRRLQAVRARAASSVPTRRCTSPKPRTSSLRSERA